MNSITAFFLEDCFWIFLDANTTGDETALLTGVFEGHPLAETLCPRFEISLEDSEFKIKAGRSEVEL